MLGKGLTTVCLLEFRLLVWPWNGKWPFKRGNRSLHPKWNAHPHACRNEKSLSPTPCLCHWVNYIHCILHYKGEWNVNSYSHISLILFHSNKPNIALKSPDAWALYSYIHILIQNITIMREICVCVCECIVKYTVTNACNSI